MRLPVSEHPLLAGGARRGQRGALASGPDRSAQLALGPGQPLIQRL